jgi:hypothetical protein
VQKQRANVMAATEEMRYAFQILGMSSAVSLVKNCLLMAFSASAPLPRTLSEDALEGSVECGLIGEATLTRNFGE